MFLSTRSCKKNFLKGQNWGFAFIMDESEIRIKGLFSKAALWNRNRNRNFLTSGTGTVTCEKVGTGTVINYGSGTGTRYKIMYLSTFI
jgi:hypothetical protein